MNEIIAQGRRGKISLATEGWKAIATKEALYPWTKAAINKEHDILRFLQRAKIDFIPDVVDGGDGWFSYTWIEGEVFSKVFKTASLDKKNQLLHSLLDKAYELDKLWVIHGELLRPHTNVLIKNNSQSSNAEIIIIDFERGFFGDFTWKNMRSLAQFLLNEQYITLESCKSLGNMTPEQIYGFLKSSVQKSSEALTPSHMTKVSWGIFIGWTSLLILLDLVSKYIFYTLHLWERSSWITPVLNTGIGRSLPVPRMITLLLTGVIIILVGFTYYKQKMHRTSALLIIAGAAGNAIDRVIYHGVRDFIDLHLRPIFNLADIYLTIAIALLLYVTFFSRDGNQR